MHSEFLDTVYVVVWPSLASIAMFLWLIQSRKKPEYAKKKNKKHWQWKQIHLEKPGKCG